MQLLANLPPGSVPPDVPQVYRFVALFQPHFGLPLQLMVVIWPLLQ